VDNDGHTAFCWACYNGHQEIVEYLLSFHCPYVPHMGILDNSGRSPLHWAASKNHSKICNVLISAKCLKCESDINEGVSNPKGGCPTGKQMLELRDSEGKTPAAVADTKGYSQLAQALEYESRGARVLNSPPEKHYKEQILQFLSSFIPHMFLVFVCFRLFPYWAILIFCSVAVWIHTSILKWSNSQKTWVPAGLLASAIVTMFYGSLFLNLSTLGLGTMVFSEMWLGLSYYNLMFGDPGVILPSESYVQRALDIAAKGIEPSSDYCRKCKVIKPPRAKHCYACDVCTSRHDHHCYWIYNCVAQRNYRLFYFWLVQLVVQIIFYVYLTATYLLDIISGMESFVWQGVPYLFTHHAVEMWTMLFFCHLFFPNSNAVFISLQFCRKRCYYI